MAFEEHYNMYIQIATEQDLYHVSSFPTCHQTESAIDLSSWFIFNGLPTGTTTIFISLHHLYISRAILTYTSPTPSLLTLAPLFQWRFGLPQLYFFTAMPLLAFSSLLHPAQYQVPVHGFD